MKALIDGDILLYKVGFACQKEHYIVYDVSWGPEAPPCAEFIGKTALNAWLGTKAEPVYNLYDAGESFPYFCSHEVREEGKDSEYTIFRHIVAEELSHVLHNVKQAIRRIVSDTGSERYTVFLTGKGNFRERVATIQKYKGNRDQNSKPIWYEEIKGYLVERHGAVVVGGAEADDAMATEQTKAGNGVDTVICTTDKDLLQVPGQNYNPTSRKMTFIPEREGLLSFYQQLLTGDSVDNIPGLYRLTGQKVTKAIKDGLQECQTEQDMWGYVLVTYNEHWPYVSERNVLDQHDEMYDALVEIGRLLYMQRHEGEVWCPPQGNNSHVGDAHHQGSFAGDEELEQD